MPQTALTFWTAEHFARVTGGTFSSAPQSDLALAGVSIDTRTLRPGDAYVAIRGERLDGHAFVSKAFEAGASLAIVAKDAGHLDADGPLLRVPDTVAALQDLAKAYRAVLLLQGVKVIAVTGSNGKTTTRRLIHAALSSRLRGTQSPKSFNNHLGVPLTLLAAGTDDDFVVTEVGTNHPGEIAALARIAQPDIAIITNVGTAHIGHFGTREAIAREKAQLAEHVQPGGLVVAPCDEDWPDILIPMPRDTPLIKVGRGDSADLRLTRVDSDQHGIRFQINGTLEATLPLLGAHNAYNAAFAIAVGRWMNLRDEQLVAALAQATPAEMRLQVTTLPGGITLLNDAYNANPNSMLAALATLRDMVPEAGGRRVAILGEMFELGDDAPAEHRHLGTAIARLSDATQPIDMVICVGRLSAFIAESLLRVWPSQRVHIFPSLSDDAARQIAALLRQGDIVLLKGSRGSALERLLPALQCRAS